MKHLQAALCSWIMPGRAAILQHDFPNRYTADDKFTPGPFPSRGAILRTKACL